MTKSDQNAQLWMAVLKFILGQKTERGIDLKKGQVVYFRKDHQYFTLGIDWDVFYVAWSVSQILYTTFSFISV